MNEFTIKQMKAAFIDGSLEEFVAVLKGGKRKYKTVEVEKMLRYQTGIKWLNDNPNHQQVEQANEILQEIVEWLRKSGISEEEAKNYDPIKNTFGDLVEETEGVNV